MSETPYFPSGSLSTPIGLVSVCPFIPISLCLSVHHLCLNKMCCPCRMAIAQHLPCLGVLLGVSVQRAGPYTSYHFTHRSTLSSQASDLSWISRRRRQESLGSESEVVRMLAPVWLAIPSLTRPLGRTAVRFRNPYDTGMLRALRQEEPLPTSPKAFSCIILPHR